MKIIKTVVIFFILVIAIGLLTGHTQFFSFISAQKMKEALFYYDIEFNSKVWKDKNSISNKEDITLRQRMVKDLLIKHKLVGMNKQEVLNLLGKDDSNDTSKNEIYYFLGMERGGFVRIDPDFLEIQFNESEVVILAQITTG